MFSPFFPRHGAWNCGLSSRYVFFSVIFTYINEEKLSKIILNTFKEPENQCGSIPLMVRAERAESAGYSRWGVWRVIYPSKTPWRWKKLVLFDYFQLLCISIFVFTPSLSWINQLWSYFCTEKTSRVKHHPLWRVELPPLFCNIFNFFFLNKCLPCFCTGMRSSRQRRYWTLFCGLVLVLSTLCHGESKL